MKAFKLLFVMSVVIFGFGSCQTNSGANAGGSDIYGDKMQKMIFPELAQLVGEWQIAIVNNKALDFSAPFKVFANGTFSAKICNSISGDIVQKERRADAVRFVNVARTQMMGNTWEMQIEDEFAVLLDKARHFAISGDSLKITDENDKLLFIFRK